MTKHTSENEPRFFNYQGTAETFPLSEHLISAIDAIDAINYMIEGIQYEPISQNAALGLSRWLDGIKKTLESVERVVHHQYDDPYRTGLNAAGNLAEGEYKRGLAEGRDAAMREMETSQTAAST